MKKNILSALLCMCVLSTISAVENPEILTSGTLKIPLVNFYPDTDQLFYTESIRPLEPYFFLKPWDHNKKLRTIRQTIYNIVHGKTSPKELFEYPETLKYLCPPNFLESLTAEGKNVYLSVLTDYATRLTGKIDYQAQRAHAHEKIPQQVRFDLWRILAQHLVFTPEFAQETDSNTIKKIFDNTLFSVLCYDREEAELISPQDKQIKAGPLKIYGKKTLLTRPTDLDLLAQTLYMLTPEAPTWTVAQAEAAIGLKRFFEGSELPVTQKEKKGVKVGKSKFQPAAETPSDAERESTEAAKKLEKSVENILDVPKVSRETSHFNLFGELIEEEKIAPEKPEKELMEETAQEGQAVEQQEPEEEQPEPTTTTTTITIEQPKKEHEPKTEHEQPSETAKDLEQKQERIKQLEENFEKSFEYVEF